MSNENSKLGAERAAFEEAAERLFGPSAPVRYVRDALPKDDPRYGEYVNPVLQGAWRAWQARASLPVGVPDGYAVVPVEPTPEMIACVELSLANSPADVYRAMLAAASKDVRHG